MLNIGDRAPDFTLCDDIGKQYSLDDFAGKTLVLYFYPKDALYGQFKALGAEVVGISKDSAASHAKFREKHFLPFILLSDPEKAVHAAYQAIGEKKLYGKVTVGTIRTTYVIKDGAIVYAKAGVSPDKNPEEVLEFIRTM